MSAPVDVLSVLHDARLAADAQGRTLDMVRADLAAAAVRELFAADREYDEAHAHYQTCRSHKREAHARMLASRERRAAALAACGVRP